MNALLLAIQFLPILPATTSSEPTEQEVGGSLLWYGVVGLLVGLLLSLLAWVLHHWVSHLVAAGILLGIWVTLTGALHLDGLADCADAWSGGRQSRHRTFEIMTDPHIGAVGVVALVVQLILKFAALAVLLDSHAIMLLLVAPAMARVAVQVLIVTTPYAKDHGLGKALADHHQPDLIWLVVLAALIVAWIIGGWSFVVALMFSGLILLGLRHMMMNRLLGFTGDTAGATIEIIELVVLFALTI